MDGQDRSDAALGVSAQPDAGAVGMTEIVAAAIGVIWIIGAGIYLATLPDAPGESGLHGLRLVMSVLVVILPAGMIWTVAATARSARIMRMETRRLQAAMEAMRQTHVAERQARGVAAPRGEGQRATAPASTGPASSGPASSGPVTSGPAAFATSREASRPASHPVRAAAQPARATEEQPRLALGTAPEDSAPPLARGDLIRAINFPDTDTDVQGFKALRLALKDRNARQLVQASQDVLTLLSRDGIYMDDLRPDRARPEIWRRFAHGERGRAVAALGGVRDRNSLALTAGRMREDTIFRDAAHHFLRRFDQMLVAFEPEASDEELIALSETRTARAFMLFGRVTGAFD